MASDNILDICVPKHKTLTLRQLDSIWVMLDNRISDHILADVDCALTDDTRNLRDLLKGYITAREKLLGLERGYSFFCSEDRSMVDPVFDMPGLEQYIKQEQ